MILVIGPAMTNTPKRPDVAAIKARAQAASGEQWFAGKMRVDSNGISESLTIGTYEAHEHFEDTICEVWEGNHDAKANVSFIVHARQDIPALITHIKALEARQVKLEAVVKAGDELHADCFIKTGQFVQIRYPETETVAKYGNARGGLAALDGDGDG